MARHLRPRLRRARALRDRVQVASKRRRISGAETRTAASTVDALEGSAWRPDPVMSDLGIAKPVEPVALLAAVARLAQPSGV